MSTKQKLSKIVSGVNAKASSKAAEKARREGIAATQKNIDRIDAGLDHEKGAANSVANASAHAFAHGEAFLLTRADGTVLAQAQTLDAAKHRARFFGIKQSAITDGPPAGFDAKAPVPPSPETAKLRKLASAAAGDGEANSAAKPRAKIASGEKKVSALDAAAQVLAKSDKPMTSQALIDEMAAKGLWKSPGGKTPHATLYAAMAREIATKGAAARFRKMDRGLFAAA